MDQISVYCRAQILLNLLTGGNSAYTTKVKFLQRMRLYAYLRDKGEIF